MPATIRIATTTDAGRIADMLTQEGYPTRTGQLASRLARLQSEDNALFVAVADGETIGAIAVHAMPRFELDDSAVRILGLVVDPAARERGVGQSLMLAAEGWAREHGAAFIEVTAGHHRPGARKLYESVGYDASLTGYLRKRL
jgi:GNAT superfamily N-acetyltransferase